jgi:hypothetical protein
MRLEVTAPLPRAPLTRGEERERVGSGRLDRSTSKAADRGSSIKLIELHERLRRPLPTLSLSASRGERRLRLLSAARGEDRQAHALAVGQDVGVPEAHHVKTRARDVSGATFIVLDLIGVLTPVDLDHQASLAAEKIQKVGAPRRLPPPRPSAQPAGAQSIPEPRLSVGLVSTKLSRSNDGCRPLYCAHFAHASDMNICRTSVQARSLAPPSPYPLPRSGERRPS